MRIRRALSTDINKIYALGKGDLDPEGWFTKDALEWDLKSNRRLCWVLEENKKVIGAMMFSEAAAGTAWCWLIVIKKDSRNRNLGRHIFNESCKRLKAKGFNRIVTDVSGKNKQSIAWHKKMGYKILGRVKDWFYMGHDAVIFCKYL